MDNLTVSAIIIAIILIFIVFKLARMKADTDKKMSLMAKQFSLILHNDKARAYCNRIHEKYPDLCAGIDFMLKVKGDNVEIEEWNSDKPRPE
jgi:hypothetical protein